MNNATNDLISFQPQETSYTAAMSNEQVLQYQDRMIADQDRGLENLSAIIGNQKRIATTIGNERQKEAIQTHAKIMMERFVGINPRAKNVSF